MPSTRLARRTPVAPVLQSKAQPRQQRALDTYELILGATVELLSEVGIERLSTNLVCQRAGISPPALYRYFPNKYALLRELGQRLMQAQNELVRAWATPTMLKLPPRRLVVQIHALFEQTLLLTKALPGGLWVTRALRAVPTLSHVRIESHALVSGLIVQAFMQAYPHAPQADVAILARLAVEMNYAALEMLFDDPSLDSQAVGLALAEMLAQRVTSVRRGGQ
ncbi:TetR/AcrR family transcriptional regulator [Rhodoferax sp.]|uniref:TetR/AcrR family transcriptional regulator n=1 Tax=Rhodoferax sp. TaxID=50421 RepID=UPI002766FAD4|nr:helix-turn-helix domain-containing protein [Rhodoferax sp.]